MTDSLEVDRRSLSFAQIEGAEPLPSQLALRELSKEVRAKLWALFWEPLRSSQVKATVSEKYAPLRDPWLGIFMRWHLNALHKFPDDFDVKIAAHITEKRGLFENGSYIEVLTFIEFIYRDRATPGAYHRVLSQVLEECRTAYRFVDSSIVPIASADDARNIETAFLALRDQRFTGARVHLRQAGEELTRGHWAASVRESIHSVESACRVLAPGTNALAPALVALEKSGTIHGGLKAGFGSLYGFSSDQKGIRHPLLDQGDANVSEADALYMFGACAAFLTYLSMRAGEGSSS